MLHEDFCYTAIDRLFVKAVLLFSCGLACGAKWSPGVALLRDVQHENIAAEWLQSQPSSSVWRRGPRRDTDAKYMNTRRSKAIPVIRRTYKVHRRHPSSSTRPWVWMRLRTWWCTRIQSAYAPLHKARTLGVHHHSATRQLAQHRTRARTR